MDKLNCIIIEDELLATEKQRALYTRLENILHQGIFLLTNTVKTRFCIYNILTITGTEK